MTQMQAIQKQQRTYSLISVAALLVAVTFMAIARYLGPGL
jgi:hypothetical protein